MTVLAPARLSDDLLDAFATPPFAAYTNGLSVCSWVPFLDLPSPQASELLTALREAGIPACLAAPRPFRRARVSRRLWVDAIRHAAAEDVARSYLCHRQAGAALGAAFGSGGDPS